MASNFSTIPIRWLLTVDSEMAFFSFSVRSLRVCLFSFKTHSVQEKVIAKPQAAQTLFVIYIRDSIALRFEPFKRMYETIRKSL